MINYSILLFQAIDQYKTALMLGNSDSVKPLHDSVVWELSTTYFNMATLLQDYAPLSSQSQEEVSFHSKYNHGYEVLEQEPVRSRNRL